MCDDVTANIGTNLFMNCQCVKKKIHQELCTGYKSQKACHPVTKMNFFLNSKELIKIRAVTPKLKNLLKGDDNETSN